MSTKENKVHTGFRLSKSNLEYIEKLGKSLGLTRTHVIDMIITLIRKDKSVLSKMIQKQLEEK